MGSLAGWHGVDGVQELLQGPDATRRGPHAPRSGAFTPQYQVHCPTPNPAYIPPNVNQHILFSYSSHIYYGTATYPYCPRDSTHQFMRPAEEEPTNGRERRALARRREAAEERREAARRKLIAPTAPLGASRFGEMCDVLGKLMANNEQFGVDGIKKSQNLWIVKPSAKSRGRGIQVKYVKLCKILKF